MDQKKSRVEYILVKCLFHLLLQPGIPCIHPLPCFGRQFKKLQVVVDPEGVFFGFFNIKVNVGEKVGFVDDTNIRSAEHVGIL